MCHCGRPTGHESRSVLTALKGPSGQQRHLCAACPGPKDHYGDAADPFTTPQAESTVNFFFQITESLGIDAALGTL